MSIIVPIAQPVSTCLTSEFSHFTFVPVSKSAVLVVQVSFEIEIILARASPRNPIVCMSNKSSSVVILLVACFEKASIMSSG